MSHYNMVFDFNRQTKRYLDAIKLDIKDIPRFRDTCLFEFEERVHLYIFTRLGANNRIDFKEKISRLVDHSGFVTTYDSDNDKSFAIFIFKLPFGFAYDHNEVLSYENLPEFRFQKLFEQDHQDIELNYGKISSEFDLIIQSGTSGFIENKTGRISIIRLNDEAYIMEDDDDYVLNFIEKNK